MVALFDWVPFFTWGLLAAGIIILLVAISKVIPYVRTLLQRFDPDVRGDPEAMAVEGIWYWLAEILRVLQFLIVILVVMAIYTFLTTSGSVGSLFDSTLGTYTVPMIIVSLGISLFKVLPWVASNRERGRPAEGDEFGEQVEGASSGEEAAK